MFLFNKALSKDFFMTGKRKKIKEKFVFNEERVINDLKEFLTERYLDLQSRSPEEIVDIVLETIQGAGKISQESKTEIVGLLSQMLGENYRDVFVENANVIAGEIYRIIKTDLEK